MVGDKGEAALPQVPRRVHGSLLLDLRAPAARARVGLPRPARAPARRLRGLPGTQTQSFNTFKFDETRLSSLLCNTHDDLLSKVIRIRNRVYKI